MQTFRRVFPIALFAVASLLGSHGERVMAAQAQDTSTHTVMPAPALLTPLGELLDADGGLKVPAGFSGSIDPQGYALVSKPGEGPRFVTKNMVDDPARWDSQFGQAIGCDGAVNAMASLPDGRVVLGGGFTICGNVVVNRVTIWNPTSGAFASLGAAAANGVSGRVDAVAVAGSDVYVGGIFSQAGGITANNVARFNMSSQTWSTLSSGVTNGVGGCSFNLFANFCVTALVANGVEIFVSGRFTEAGGAAANRVARFNATTQTWSSLGTGAANGVNGIVEALALSGSDVYVGGFFTEAGGAQASNVARFDSSTQTWHPLGPSASNGVNSSVNALATDGNNVYLGGSFTQAGGASANRVARFNSSTETWSSLGIGQTDGVNDSVYAVTIAGGDVYFGGDFDQAGGAAANAVARFRISTQTWSPLGNGLVNGVDRRVNDLASVGDNVYVGGLFAEARGSVANRVARFNSSTETWSALGTGSSNGVNDSVNTLAVAGSSIYVGGVFTQVGGVAANNVARFDTITQSWSSLGSDVSNGVSGPSVDALAVIGSDVYVGGFFGQAGGVAANNIARFDTSTQTWFPLGSEAENGVEGAPGTVDALVVSGSDLYVGGGFSKAGGAAANSVARFNVVSQTWFTLGSGTTNGVNGSVSAIAVDGADVYVGGSFSEAGGVQANSVARFNSSTQGWFPLGTPAANGVNDQVLALAVAGSDIYIGGRFTQAGGTSANLVARFDRIAEEWLPLGTAGANGVAGILVNALAVADSDVYVAGYFGQAGGVPAAGIARFNRVTQGWSSLGIGASNGLGCCIVRALVVLDSDLYLGGDFTSAGPNVSLRIARYDARRETTSSIVGSSGLFVSANTSVTFTGTIATTSFPAQPGAVEFLDNGVLIPGCANQTLVGGLDTRSATCTTASLRVGTHSIVARYKGDTLNFFGTSDPTTITVTAPALSVSPATLPNALAGVNYVQVLGVSGIGATLPITHALTSGALPNGLTLLPNGQIAGVPSTPGTFGFTITATDASTTSATGGAFSAAQSYTVTTSLQSTSTTVGAITPAPSEVGVAYQVPVTVSAAQSTPTGVVQCSDGSGASDTRVLSGGATTCTLTSLVAGTKTITATYSGSTFHDASVGTAQHTVQVGGTSSSTVIVGQRLAPRGREVPAPVSIRGNGTTSSVLAIVQFDDTQLDLVRVQAVAPATCVREGATAGTIAARQIRVTTPNTSTTPFPNGIERALCDIVLRPKATASGGLTALTVPQSTCIDGIGNATNCSTQAGAIGINSLETNPRPGSTLSMSEVVGQPVARDALLIRNAGTMTMTGVCSITAGNGFAVASGANYSVAPGGTVSVGLECTLPGNPDVPLTGGLLTCTTPTDTALGDLFWSLSCDARRASEPVPESQLRRENLAANAQFGASGANLPNGGGASMAVGAPGAGSDFSGEVYLLGMGPQIAGKSAQRPYPLRDITVQGIVSAPRQKNELPDLCFGRSIATTADGTRMAVGAPGRCSANSSSTDPGKVVIYLRPAEGWSEAYDAGFGSSQILTAPLATGGVLPQEFGAALSYLPDGRLLVGAPGADSGVADDVGQAYLYTASGGALATTPTRIASPQGGVFAGRFGAAVAAGSEFLVIGAPGEGAANSRRGMAYVVNFANGEPLPAAPVTTTTAAGDNTGRSVLVVGNLVFVGVPGADTSVGTNSGAVRVFRRNADGSTLEVARLIPQPPAGGAPSAGANQALGASLSSNGVTLFAGAPDATENGNTRQGRTYAYRIDDRWASTTTSVGDVPATAVLINVGGSANEAFGSAVVVGPGSALIGAPESSLDNGAVQKVGRADLFGMEELFRSGFER